MGCPLAPFSSPSLCAWRHLLSRWESCYSPAWPLCSRHTRAPAPAPRHRLRPRSTGVKTKCEDIHCLVLIGSGFPNGLRPLAQRVKTRLQPLERFTAAKGSLAWLCPLAAGFRSHTVGMAQRPSAPTEADIEVTQSAISRRCHSFFCPWRQCRSFSWVSTVGCPAGAAWARSHHGCCQMLFCRRLPIAAQVSPASLGCFVAPKACSGRAAASLAGWPCAVQGGRRGTPPCLFQFCGVAFGRADLDFELGGSNTGFGMGRLQLSGACTAGASRATTPRSSTVVA